MTLTLRFLIVIWTLFVLFSISKVWLRSQLVTKTLKKPTCIDLFLTNSPSQFQATLTLETSLSDFHNMTAAAFKLEFPHQKPKMISYQNYKHIDRNNVEKEMKSTLLLRKILSKDFSAFKNIALKALNLHALLKTKYLPNTWV